jgi:DNA polymerase-1
LSLDNVKLHLIETMDDVAKFNDWLNSRDRDQLGFDTETTGLDLEKDHVRLVQIGDEEDGWAMSWERWSGVFEDTVKKFTGNWVAHNAPYDQHMTAKAGIKVERSQILDARPMAHIVDPTGSMALKPLSGRYVDKRAGNAQQDLDDGVANWGWANIPINFEPYWSYGALDPVLTMQLGRELWTRVVDHGATKAFDVENAVQWITHDMGRYGTNIDTRYALTHYEKFNEYCDLAEMWCKKEYNVSPGSNAAVIKVLHEAGVEFTKRTKGGAISLDADVLEGIDHPLAQTVLKRRKLQKLASTYLKHYITEVDGDSLIHPSFNTLGARTSRMSMSNPNMQNLPRVSEYNHATTVIRNCVHARPEHTLIFCDFSQIEMRMLAWLCKDPGLVAAFLSGDDFFVSLAQQVYHDLSIDKKHPLRQRVKNVGYAKIYGAGDEKIAVTAGVPYAGGRASRIAFDQAFPLVSEYVNINFHEAMLNKSVFGYPFVNCPLTGRRHPADSGKEYTLVNFQIQGAAAVLFKMKMLELDQAGLGPWMMLAVHDEIILDVPNEYVPDAVHKLQQVMNDDVIMAPVPITAEVSFGQRWGEKHDWNEALWRELTYAQAT